MRMRVALEPRILILCPLAREWSFLVSTFEASLHAEHLHDLKIDAAYIPDWRALVAPGGHGKTQFAVQAQYLIGRFSSVELVICAGAAGSLAPELSVGDVVVGTETVEHDYRLLFATRRCRVSPAMDRRSTPCGVRHMALAASTLPSM
jgi:adenosylhomocysteine nucleosidase